MNARLILAFSFATFFLGIQSLDAYRLNDRWSRTATDGFSLGSQGDPSTITYSIVPNGTTVQNLNGQSRSSDLITMLDNEFGSQATWLPLIQQSFDRWDAVSGLTTVYEPNDDGVTMSNSNRGILGTRGDVRIGGTFLDGSSNVLAFNYFPDFGDMVLDTADGAFYDSPTNNFRLFRNTIMHEHGHGLGMSHVESSNARFLMEPFIQSQFDGPQFDDILAAHRGYGDRLEEGDGNNTFGFATSFGTIADGATASIGTSALNVPTVPNSATDFVSVDDNSDFDYYSFTVNANSDVDIVLDPRGPTYNEGPQNGSQSPYNTRALSNLQLRLYDTDGTTLLETQNVNGAGSGESINDFSVGAGTYFVRVSGAANNVQMYRLDVSVTETGLVGDYTGNSDYDCPDIDQLVAAVVGGSTDTQYDLDGNGLINHDDVVEWLAIAGAAENASGNPYLPGDANLNGVVDGIDFTIWSQFKFTPTPAWCAGDFNSSGTVDGIDFTIWSQFKFQSSRPAVPEPGSALLALLGLSLLAMRRR